MLREESDYWITTADHKTYRVTRVVGADPRSDLAVLAVDAHDLVPITFGDGSKLKKGQIVIALGNPYAIARDGEVSASWGIVANLARKDAPTPALRDDVLVREKVDVAPVRHPDPDRRQIEYGHQRRGLVEPQGRNDRPDRGLGFHGRLREIGRLRPAGRRRLPARVKTLKEGREVEYGLLGVRTQALPRDQGNLSRRGVVVESVVPGTPADRAGFLPGDLITQVDDHEIVEPDDLLLAIGRLPADGSAWVTIERGGRRQALAVHELSKYHVKGHLIVTNLPPAWRGLRVDYVTNTPDFDRKIQQRNVDPSSVLISEVEENSPAWHQGLRPNMMISHVAGNPVGKPKQFREAVAGKSGPVRLRLSLGPGGDRSERTIPPDGE